MLYLLVIARRRFLLELPVARVGGQVETSFLFLLLLGGLLGRYHCRKGAPYGTVIVQSERRIAAIAGQAAHVRDGSSANVYQAQIEHVVMPSAKCCQTGVQLLHRFVVLA